MRRFYCESLCMNKLLKALGRKDSSQRVVFILGGARYGFISGYIQADAHTDATLDHTGSRVTVKPGLPPPPPLPSLPSFAQPPPPLPLTHESEHGAARERTLLRVRLRVPLLGAARASWLTLG